MLFLSSTIRDTSILSIASMLLQSTPPNTRLAYELASLIHPDVNAWDIRLRLSLALLVQGQIQQAERITDNFDFVEYIQRTQNISIIKSLFNLIPYVQDSRMTIELLDYVESNKVFDRDSLIELKIRTANIFIMIGKGDAGEMILKSISPETIANQDHLGLLGFYYIYLSKFESAAKVFDVAKQKELTHQNLSVFMAINQFCLNDFGKAKITIDNYAINNHRTPLNFLWKAKLLNYEGQFDEALQWIEKALCTSVIKTPVQRCFCLIEKGNILKSLWEIDRAIKCYKEAIVEDHGSLFWLWIAYFEYSMTLVYLGRIDDALAAALKACSYKSYKYNSKFNPCSILSGFLSFRIKQFQVASAREWADKACLWPFPYMSYKFWMLILTGTALEKNRFYDDAKSIYYRIMATNKKVNETQLDRFSCKKENDILFHDHNLMDAIRSKCWPNDFNWNVIRLLINKNI